MKHPIVIGIASIFPGLGHFLLGRYRHALYIFLFLISLCSLSVFLTEKALYFFMGFWAVQIIFAVRTAQLEKSQSEENSFAPKESDEILVPNELSRKEKYLFKIRETLKLQLDIGENLVESLFATLGKYRQYYLGLTNKHLVIIELDFLAKPLDVKKIPLSDLEKVLYNSGLLFEEITFHQTNGKLIKFQIFHQYKEQAKNLVSEFKREIAQN